MNTILISSNKNNDDTNNLNDNSFILNNKDIQRTKSPISNTSEINFNSMLNNSNNNNSGSSSSDDTNTIFSDAISLSTDERCGSTNTIGSNEDNLDSKLSNYLNISSDDFLIKNNDFLNHINPMPSKPPSYTKMNPNRLIRYPIYENIQPCSINEKPPIYSPTIEKFTIVSIKSEYLSPYEPSNSKIWKNFIMEINSTQLNFYYIDSSLTHRIKNYSSGCESIGNGLYHLDNSTKAKFFNFNHKATYNFNKYDQEHICYQIQRYKKNFICQERLYKSFSLQFAKFGIPIDYNKKTFVLRMRCESEQFLINFAHVDDMINWTTYLSMGISVSLDLELREMPDYRIVPRRRRRRHRRRRHSRHRRHGFVTSTSGNSYSRARSHSNSFSTRTRDIMTSHLSESALGALSESVSRKNSISNNRKNSNISTTSSNTQSLDQSFSSMTIDSSSRSSTNNRNSNRRCSSINLQDSPYNTISNSKNNNSSGTNLKSKLKGLFKIGYTPQKSTSISNASMVPISIPSSPRSRSISSSVANSTAMNAASFISVSPTNTTTNSPVMRSNSFKNNYSSATSLNSLIEDEDENDESLPGGMQFSRKQNSVLRSVSSSPLYQAAHMKAPQIPQYICPKDTTTNSDCNPTHKLVQRNSIILQHELDELHEVLREHQDSDIEDDEDEDEDDMDEDDIFDETQQHNVSIVTSSYDRMNSVYSDEGIFHDSDNEDYYPNFRNRASSLMSSLSYGVGNDEVKWHPPIYETSRKRYIRNSLRCIRPFLEDNEWVGFVCFKPTRCPPYETNNKPITYNGKNCTGKTRKNSNSSYRAQDYSNVKNHYLESFVVGPVDFIRADTPTIRRINKIKSKKSKDDDVESRLLLAYGA